MESTTELNTITATRINELHQGLTVLLHKGIEKAVEIGMLLSEKKAELKHGEFGTWIKDNLVFTDRTARNYMKLFENKDKVLQAGNITEGYRMLSEHNENGNVSDLDGFEFITVLERLDSDLKYLKLCVKYLHANRKPDLIPAPPEIDSLLI